MTEHSFELAADENVLKEVPAAGAKSLVSDGNSRWVEEDGIFYFVANSKYKAPDVADA